MMIGVMLKDALPDGHIAIVPLDTCYVKADEQSIRASCDRELKMIYAVNQPNSSYEIVGLASVIEKISSCNSL